MYEIEMTADELVSALLNLSKTESVCLLDSCGVGYLSSHLLIAGIDPVDVIELSNTTAHATLAALDERLIGALASFFTISYDLGRKLLNIDVSRVEKPEISEPDIFLAAFDVLIVHDYSTGTTRLAGNVDKFETVERTLESQISNSKFEISDRCDVRSNFTRTEYLAAVETIQELIRKGDTYQTNLTQQLRAELADELTPQAIFGRLRRDHPAPFSSFFKRPGSTVVSASPERFFRVDGRTISTSPIKGTRPRGETSDEDIALRNDLLSSEKDRAENRMIVDLLRNDTGRICEYGTVIVEKLCDLEEHPTFFHLVSTITGELRPDARIADILRAVFPCGSITGAPKISTMRIIDEIEPLNRGLSMGAIGYYAPEVFGLPATLDLSVAIRTMVIRGRVATFNVGGGITIDSDPDAEYAESLLKAQALVAAINGTILE